MSDNSVDSSWIFLRLTFRFDGNSSFIPIWFATSLASEKILGHLSLRCWRSSSKLLMLLTSISSVALWAWRTLLRRSIATKTLSQILDKRMHENELIYLRRAWTSFLVSDDKFSWNSASKDDWIPGIWAAKGLTYQPCHSNVYVTMSVKGNQYFSIKFPISVVCCWRYYIIFELCQKTFALAGNIQLHVNHISFDYDKHKERRQPKD